ncbi:MAG: hypothetical protein QNJ30_18580 [Kiloniellales bacterium]|nr:hypothetical protein [Kiloniellales bacterium]
MTKGFPCATASLALALAVFGSAAAQAEDEASYQAICEENAPIEQCTCLLRELKGNLSPQDYQAFLTVSVASARDPAKTLEVMRAQANGEEEVAAMSSRIAGAVAPATKACGIIK